MLNCSHDLTLSDDAVCYIEMYTSLNAHEKISIRVERGPKPTIKCNEDKRKVQITIPLDATQNWPILRSDLFGDYYIVIQRLQQQFKIYVQNTKEKKPEFIIYSSTLSHEKEVKTQIRDLNTRLTEVCIAAPNLDLHGVLKAPRISLESTIGTMHIYARIESEKIRLHAQNLVIAPEALISTNKLKMVARKVQVDGRIFPSETGPPDEPRVMSVMADAQLVHIGVDGRIGEGNDKENCKQARSHSQPPQVTADGLLLQISGSLANYGKIVALEKVDLVVSGSVMSLSEGWLDSASRGYDALKQIRGIGKAEECKPSSSSLHSAIKEQNANAVAKLIESGVDKNDKTNSKRLTLRQTAMAKYRQAKEKSTQNKERQGITLINALLTVHDWRRGSIQAAVIQANIGRDCEDCAQFNAEQLQVTVGGKAAVEADSIWHCAHVEMEVGGSFTIAGQVKHKTAVFSIEQDTVVSSEAIISHEILARLTTRSLTCDGIWSSGDTLVIEARGGIAFKGNSYVEAEKLEAAGDGCCLIQGTWQIGSLWLSVVQDITTSSDGKVFIEDSSTVKARSFLCSGIWNVNSTIDAQLKDSCHCFHSSRIEAHTLRISCEKHCTIGGLWMAEALHLYARHDLITTSTGKVTICEALVTTGTFRNDSTWQVERWMNMTCGSIEQSEDGTILAKDRLELNVHENSKNLAGKIITSHAAFKILKTLESEAFIRVNEIEVNLPYMNDSQFIFHGQMDILSGSLTLKGNSDLQACKSDSLAECPAFILHGKLNATAIIAPFLAVELGSTSIVRLFGAKSHIPEIDFNVLLSTGALTTRKGSSVVSMGDSEISEGIICASTWSHAGQIRFQTNNVRLHTGSLLYSGRLTSVADKQNHVTDLQMIVDDLLLNEGIISAHRLKITGDGRLDNRNRIFAVDEMNIRLANFDNDHGSMESKNSMKLLAVSKEWTRVAGNIKAKSSFDICAQKLNLALQNVHHLCKEQVVQFSAKDELMLSSNIVDATKKLKVACSAENKVLIGANVEIDHLEVLLGGNLPMVPSETPHQFSILNTATVSTRSVLINGNSPLVVLSIDGVLKCKTLRVAPQIRTVLITGKGSLECASLQVEGDALCVDLYQTLTATDISCAQIEVKKRSIVRLSPPETLTTRLMTDRLLIGGTIFVDSRLYLTSLSHGSILQVNGSIIGTTTESEVSIECDQLIQSGELSNLAFLEIYAKNGFKTSETSLSLHNISNISLEAGQANLNLKVDNCKTLSIHGDQLTCTGTIRGVDGSKVNIFGGSVNESMEITNVDVFEVQARRQLTMGGKISKCKMLNLDAKWLTNTAKVEDSTGIVIKAWSLVSMSPIMAEEISITCLSVFLNNSILHAESLKIVVPFIVSLMEKSDVFASKSQIHSIVCACNHEMASTANADPTTSYLWLDFDSSCKTASISEETAKSWRETASMLKDRMKSNTSDLDETILALKYIAELSHARVKLPEELELYEDLNKICTRFSTQPISLFSVSKFSALIANSRSQCRTEKIVSPIQDHQKRRSGKRRSMDCALYEGLVQFKSTKYNRESRNSSETVDGGYVSRGSSEDLERKSDSDSPLPSPTADRICSAFPLNHSSFIASTFDGSCNSPIPSAEELNESFMTIEEVELLEFEELEQEIEEEESGRMRTDFIICGEIKIRLAQLREKYLLPPPPPRPQSRLFPLERTPSSNDLVMKRIKVKSTLSSLDLRTFGSNSSLNSIDLSQLGDLGSPMQFPKSNVQRSLIPRGPFRHQRPRIPESPLKG